MQPKNNYNSQLDTQKKYNKLCWQTKKKLSYSGKRFSEHCVYVMFHGEFRIWGSSVRKFTKLFYLMA
jgi:hypothetical protein